ncbi:PLP-dependent cysteine synthase family protein [Campylobacter canadensis]|uniref:Cysteine synthase family protein n=1 Tax=Campylobacter canadensis TaxID=449520 RepID=A0ABS7WT17_9BACT|nr:cysteine synthase family protein [Campylobacter canadensis]MBZ7987902.1 cysteine synthase family protein [Campylobacter canadensis]MBZ7995352.1 cysteine synthase family protein [Campylobacter canadensis]MBZ7996322.1 cysteine synthase family protein [Campylobacter canadensis]MBZ7998354.1 cysteine synthase family protein [Campylobacter canadensis]MBZ8000069.1 cysteine synthase family protein [Campylobacter canadensis]
MLNKIQNYKKLVGNTPLVRVNYSFNNKKSFAFFKLECFNPSGSIKDRMAINIIEDAYKDKSFKEGMGIKEATSGNTGIAFSALGAYLGCEVEIFMPSWMSEERKKLILSYGAKLREVSKEEGGFSGSVRLADIAASKENAFRPQQFDNLSNVKAHITTGQEIINDLQKINLKADCFVAGVGTGGTIMGVAKALKAYDSNIKVCPVEPEGCASMTYPGQDAEHLIQGIGDGFVPSIVKLDELDDIIIVNDVDSVIMAQKLAKSGLGVGISSGANFLAAIKAKELYGDCIVTSVFADCSKKYLSTKLCENLKSCDKFLSSKIDIISYEVLK